MLFHVLNSYYWFINQVKRVLLYDPVLGVEEIKALERFGVEIIKTNEVS